MQEVPTVARARSKVNRFSSMRSVRASTSTSVSMKTLMKARRSVASTRPGRVKGSFFEEARPVEGNAYFPASKATTAVVVCLYNEVGPELSRTIESLVASDTALDIVVVADGLAKLSGSMKQYLTRTFELDPTNATPLLNGEPLVWQPRDQTFISPPTYRGSSSLTLLLKRFNHKKINTHEVPPPAGLDPTTSGSHPVLPVPVPALHPC
jgi:hypothetical protein